jgi:protein MAK11
VFDAKKLVERGSLFGHKGTVNALSFSLASDVLLSGGADGNVLLWKTKEWERIAMLQGHTGEVSTVACHPTGAVAVSGSRDCTQPALPTMKYCDTLSRYAASVGPLHSQVHQQDFI